MRENSKSSYKQAVVSAQLSGEEEYWINKLAGQLTRSAFPYHREKTQNRRKPASVKFSITGDTFLRLMKLSNKSDYRLHMIIVAGLVALIDKYTGNKDIIVGTPALKQDFNAEFVNTALALRIRVDSDGMTFKELLLHVKQTITGANENQNYPLEQLPRRLGLPFSPGDEFPLFDIAVLTENIQDKAYLRHIPVNMTFSFFRTVGAVEGEVEYNSLLYDKPSMERLAAHFSNLLETALFNVDVKIADIDILAEEEKEQLLFEFNNTKKGRTGYNTHGTIHERFEEQVEKTPHNTAVVDGSGAGILSYGELNERSNRLARLLRSKGVTREKIVGVLVERSIDMVVGILGVLKAGGVYLPMDTAYPVKRIQYMLTDSGVEVLIARGDRAADLEINEIIPPDDKNLNTFESDNPGNNATPGDLLYVIYTSGSTGKPKGVLVEHRGFVNLVDFHKKIFGEDQHSNMSQVAGPGFDAMAFEVWPCLLHGAALYIADNETRADSSKMKHWLIRNKITISYQPTVIAELLLKEEWPQQDVSLRALIAAGDRLTQFPGPRHPFSLYNLYGPTEDTVWTTWSKVEDGAAGGKLPGIGTPVADHFVYILGPNLKLQPIGVTGEMCIGGAGVARGYLNRPQLTGETFVDNPFGREGRLYRTGDLAVWLPGGNLQFKGRVDHQVKIRGFRIELGEIEGRLSGFEKIKEAVVTARESENGDKYLCAYILFKPGTAPENMPHGTELREYVAAELPGHMVPSYFVRVEEIPLTPNGKIDHKALPAPEGISLDSNDEYIPPRNAVEKELAALWERVLGRGGIGIDDNFFMVGGDSIKSIQILSGMNTAGYKVDMKELFQYPTISQLAPRVKALDHIAGQSTVTGTVPLTPIQHWFFQNTPVHPFHFNQAVMLYSKEGFDEDMINVVFGKILEHHDALRMTFKHENGKMIQTNFGLDYPLSLQVFDLRDRENETIGETLKAKANEIQSSFDLETGPLMKLGLFRLNDGDRLLIVVHHLVIDGVSWRILFEDIEHLKQQYKRGDRPVLPLKTDSFKTWAGALLEYADSKAFLKEKTFWAQLDSAAVPPIPKDFLVDDNYRKDGVSLTFSLSEEETGLLLTKVNGAFGTEINDILLTALGLGIKKTWGNSRMLIALEGHGREDILENIGVGRTVGWFTSGYPVLLDVSYDDTARLIKEVKETLRRIPNKGIGYGILRYLTSENNKKEMGFNLEPQVGFNYLGQFDSDVDQMSFGVESESVGAQMSPEGKRETEIGVVGMTTGNRLTMTVTYNKKLYKPAVIEALTAHFFSELGRIITFCSSREARERTPSDFTYTRLPIDTVDRLTSEYPVEDIYTLTPMQQGMLFYSMYDDSSSAYFQQASYRLRGELDVGIVKRSLNELLKRHGILRTAFIHEGLNHPVQVVLKNRQIDFSYENISQMGGAAEKESFIQEFKEKDRRRSFVLDRDVLMRVSILQPGESEYDVIWSFHHMLMDGWCIGILNSEFFEIYNALQQNRPPQLSPVVPYQAYIRWLEKQDKEVSGNYWREYLDSYEEAAVVPGKSIGIESGKKEYRQEHVTVLLDSEKTGRLNKLAGNNHVTLNIITQAVWGIMLGKYNGKEDVVFGAVVSGRPYELEGVEAIIGLFINTVPVRITFENETKFNRLLKKIREEAVDSERHHYYPLAEIQSESTLKQNLLDHILVFENYPTEIAVDDREKGVTIELSNVSLFEQSNYDFNIMIIPTADQLVVKFDYNRNVYDRDIVDVFAGHFRNVLHQVTTNDEIPAAEITLLDGDEKHRVLYEFNNTKAGPTGYKTDMTIHELFEDQVEKTPENTAVVDGDGTGTVSYNELNERSNRLAALLRSKGVTRDIIVGVLVERSIDLMVGMLGILKAGGAYLPIDTAYPVKRIQYMLKDSGVELLYAQRERAKGFEIKEIVPPDDEDINKFESFNPGETSNPGDLLYVIYTSGSTGKPKGVLVEHRGFVNLIDFHKKIFREDRESRLSQVASAGFDAMAFEVWPCLVNGAALYIADNETRADSFKMKNWLIDNKISISYQPTIIAELLLKEEWPEQGVALRALIAAGDRLTRYPESRHPFSLYNLYGPTEDTVWTTWSKVEDGAGGNLPGIGTPVDNHFVYIVDSNLKPQPIGVPGEMCIGGAGVARGYLNRPLLTGETFVENSFGRDGRLYRTGDLAVWLPGGNLEFKGRIDHQVKIRGFRIELGEIESRLSGFEKIKEAVVTAGETGNGDKYLCAFFVYEPGADPAAAKTPTAMELREYLAAELPDHMIPSYFLEVEEIPVTANGKIDRKALPDSLEKGPDSDTQYVAPRNTVEEKLVEIWENVLGKDRIGINDNFFIVGGDSIKAIRIISQMRKTGYKVVMQDIFRHRVIAELAPFVSKTDREADQRLITGNIALTPIQEEFFRNRTIDPHHFNQAVMLNSKERIGKETIIAVMKKILEHHDALRMTYKKVEDRILQTGHGLDYPFYLEEFDLRGRKDAPEAIGAAAGEIQAGINLENGPLMKLGLFHLDNEDRLLIVVHHLVIDGVSWRILLEDIELLYRHYKKTGYKKNGKEEPPLLPLKTDSFKHWSDQLHRYSRSSELLNRLEYWREIEDTELTPLPVDHTVEPGKRRLKYSTAVSVDLGEEETAMLLQDVHHAYNTEINDILLTALALAVNRWTRRENVLIELEGHGREEIIEDIDVSRTVGWFTTTFPVILQVPPEEIVAGTDHLKEALKENKERLRAIPTRGIGYGILRYLTPDDKKEGVDFSLEPEIGFNYLGQFGQERGPGEQVFSMSTSGTGAPASPGQEMARKIDINGMISDGRLMFSFTYNRYQYEKTTIETLAGYYKDYLLQIVRHCSGKEDSEKTLSDYTADIDEEQLENVYETLHDIFES